jgi:hypothetical protein
MGDLIHDLIAKPAAEILGNLQQDMQRTGEGMGVSMLPPDTKENIANIILERFEAAKGMSRQSRLHKQIADAWADFRHTHTPGSTAAAFEFVEKDFLPAVAAIIMADEPDPQNPGLKPPPLSSGDVTPELVVKSLAKRPDLLAGVRSILLGPDALGDSVFGVLKEVFPINEGDTATVTATVPPTAPQGDYLAMAVAESQHGSPGLGTVSAVNGGCDTVSVPLPSTFNVRFGPPVLERALQVTFGPVKEDVVLHGLRLEVRLIRET